MSRQVFDLDAARAVLSSVRNSNHSIQGFLYGDRHVVRDVSLAPEKQVLWQIETDDYETGHAAMMAEIEKIGDERVLVSLLAHFGVLADPRVP